jgi:hypothetical protein
MKEAHDHKRVTAVGRAVGEQIVRLTEPAINRLEIEGEADERCRSCAFRAGTVPNGCPQTMSDVVKCVVEQTPFFCHVDKYSDGSDKICHGWFAAAWALGDRPPGKVPWEFSPADEPVKDQKEAL